MCLTNLNSPQLSFTIVSKEELPFHCPPKESSKWNMHPKVFLPFDEFGMQVAHTVVLYINSLPKS